MKKYNNKNKKKQEHAEQYQVEEQTELLAFLLDALKSRSRNSVKSILARGQVLVNDQVRTAFDYPLEPGSRVSIHKHKIIEKNSLKGLTILYEDEDLLVVNKSTGLLSIASDKEKEMTAYRQLTDYVRNRNPKNRVFIVHRLDRDTSGVMMFAKNERVKRLLQDSWKKVVKERSYIALVEGNVKNKSGTIKSWLTESRTHKMYSSPFDNGGQHAVTHFKVIQSNHSCSLLEVNLETGRKNQIRVHMQETGHSIVGDKKYGSKVNLIGRLGLHARILTFTHPITGKELRFKTEIPSSFLAQSK